MLTPLLAASGELPLRLAQGTLPGDRQPWLCVGLLLVGMAASLFPDLDAPQSELLHAPRKLTRGASWTMRTILGPSWASGPGKLLQLLLATLGWLVGGLLVLLSLGLRSITQHRGLTHELRGMLLCTSLVLLATAGLAAGWQVAPETVLRLMALVGAAWTLGYLTHLLLDAATISGIPLFSERRMFHLLPQGWRFRTGSWPDTLLLRGLAIGWLLLLVGLTLST